MQSESRTCPACERRLSEGVPDVFCPECALREALAAGAESKNMKPDSPRAGDVVEDYEIMEKVGGNMGLVFKARHRLLHKIVALKIFPAEWIKDGARLARF